MQKIVGGTRFITLSIGEGRLSIELAIDDWRLDCRFATAVRAAASSPDLARPLSSPRRDRAPPRHHLARVTRRLALSPQFVAYQHDGASPPDAAVAAVVSSGRRAPRAGTARTNRRESGGGSPCRRIS